MPRPENSFAWSDIGQEFFQVESYTTGAEISEFADWSSGSAVSLGESRYFDGRDYEALVSISSGSNTISPAACLVSPDEDIAARWVDLGPANAFKCLDSDAATATKATGSLTMTLRGEGACDRLSFWALHNAVSVSATVAAGELIPNNSFVSDALPWTGSTNVSASWSSGQVTITHSGYASAAGDYYLEVSGLTVGQPYAFAADVTCGVSDQWALVIQPAGGGSAITTGATQTGSATDHSITWTATETTQRLIVRLIQGTQDITLTEVRANQDGYTQESISDTLQDASTGIRLRNTVLPHTKVTAPEYAITITGIHAAADVYGGMIAASEAVTVGCTHANVEVGGQSYSRLAEDDYGVSQRVRRRRARQFAATVQLNELSGDLLDQVLWELEGVDAMFDFNDDSTSYSRLQLFGWAENWSTIVTGFNDGQDYMDITMRSLVETISYDD